MKYIRCLMALALLAGGYSALGQNDDSVVDSDSRVIVAERPVHALTDTSRLTDNKRWDFHLSMGTALAGSRFGSASVFSVTPSVIYRPNDKLTVHASASALNSYTLAPNGYRIEGVRPRSYAPLRHPSAAVAGAVNLAMTYRVNERLWLGASLFHMGGQMASDALMNPFLPPATMMDMNLTAFTASLRYKLREDSFLDMHMTVINDPTGALGPLYYGSLYGGLYGAPYGGIYGGPYGGMYGSSLGNIFGW